MYPISVWDNNYLKVRILNQIYLTHEKILFEKAQYMDFYIHESTV